jgi:hypothetical protein
MSYSVDIKSCLIGGLLVLVVACCIAAAVYQPSQLYLDRFKIEASQEYAFVLDSATGQVWIWSVSYANDISDQAAHAFQAPKVSSAP